MKYGFPEICSVPDINFSVRNKLISVLFPHSHTGCNTAERRNFIEYMEAVHQSLLTKTFYQQINSPFIAKRMGTLVNSRRYKGVTKVAHIF